MTALFPFMKAEDFGPIKKGRWKRDSHNRIFCCCPGCGRVVKLDHEVDDDGKVTPSLDCPTEVCHFHRFAMLLDWEP